MFKGTKERNARQLSEMVEGAGGEMNAYTTKETTSYHVFSLDETFEAMKGLMADMMTSPLIDEEHVDLEKGVVLQEISMLEDDPEDYSRVLLDSSIWEGNPMSRTETGHPECVSKLKARDLREFFEGHYRPPNMCVVACGNVNAGKVIEWVEDTFDGLPQAVPNGGRTPPVPKACTKVFPWEGDQAYVEMGFPGLPSTHPDRKALMVACIIMGGGTSSRLYQTVREDQGLVYHISMFPQAYTDCGIVDTFFSASMDKMDRVIATLAKELTRFKDEGPSRGSDQGQALDQGSAHAQAGGNRQPPILARRALHAERRDGIDGTHPCRVRAHDHGGRGPGQQRDIPEEKDVRHAAAPERKGRWPPDVCRVWTSSLPGP